MRFAGGFLAAIRGGRAPGSRAGLDQAIVSASFALEDWGARGLISATRGGKAERRLREWLGSRAER